jgi:predicted nucleic acid-binding protein
MIIVLDTSAAAEVVLGRTYAEILSRYIENADRIIAPGLFIPEITNVFWKYYKFGNMSAEQCREAIDRSIDIPDEYCDEKGLYKEAFKLACLTGKPVYDMYFLVPAQQNNAFLATMDEKLKTLAQNHSVQVLQLRDTED